MKPARTPSADARVLVRELLGKVAADDRPVVVGPWKFEVGHESLYWIPFLTWLFRTRPIDPRRVVFVSRGGVRSWYDAVLAGARYLDIFDHISPAEYVGLTQDHVNEAGTRKTVGITRSDRTIMGRLGLPEDAHMVHPSLMFSVLGDYWRGSAGFRLLRGATLYERRPPPDHPVVSDLPPRFAAVKFYSRLSFLQTDANRTFVERLVLRLADAGPVVFLDNGLQLDDHVDFAPPSHPNVISLRERITPGDNLGAQAAALSRASQVFCTYGGFAYVPLYYGVPTLSFFSEPRQMLPQHGRAVFYMADQLQTPFGVSPRDVFAVASGLR